MLPFEPGETKRFGYYLRNKLALHMVSSMMFSLEQASLVYSFTSIYFLSSFVF